MDKVTIREMLTEVLLTDARSLCTSGCPYYTNDICDHPNDLCMWIKDALEDLDVVEARVR